MARSQETKSFKTVDGDCDITVTALDGNAGGELGIRLMQLFGPSIVGVVAAMESDDMAKISEQASILFQKLTPAEFTAVKKQLLRGAQAALNGEFVDVDDRFIGEQFAGRVGGLMSLVFFALKVNYQTFFEDLGIKKETIAKLTVRAQKATKAVSG